MILSYFASAYIADAISPTADPADAHGDGSFSVFQSDPQQSALLYHHTLAKANQSQQ